MNYMCSLYKTTHVDAVLIKQKYSQNWK